MKRAVLVGINKYAQAPLRGCVNDCLLMHKVLTEKFGFKNENIYLLLDEDATKAKILKRLRTIAKKSQPGDTLYFHFSGHGSQVIVNDKTKSNESDGLDEIICPYDFDWNDPLRDNDLNKIISIIPKNVLNLFVLDCCHSGTGLRNTWKSPDKMTTEHDWVNRFMPPPPSNLLKDSTITLDNNLNFVSKKAIKPDTQFLVHTLDQGDAILISGCRDNQVSADAWIGERYHGALTFCLASVLQQKNYSVTLKELVLEINKQLKEARFTQEPQLECKQSYFNEKFLIKKKVTEYKKKRGCQICNLLKTFFTQ